VVPSAARNNRLRPAFRILGLRLLATRGVLPPTTTRIPATPVGLSLIFTSDAFSGGLLNSSNTSGVTFVNLRIDVSHATADRGYYSRLRSLFLAVKHGSGICPRDFFGGPGISDGALENPFCTACIESDVSIHNVNRGQVSTQAQIRKCLAPWHDVDVTCPLVTGIFLRIGTEATEEDRMAGKADTPCWRVPGEDGWLNPKFPGGTERQAERLRVEGHIRRARKGYDRGKPRRQHESPVVIMKIIRNVIPITGRGAQPSANLLFTRCCNSQ